MALTLGEAAASMPPLTIEIPETTWWGRLLVRLHVRTPRRRNPLDMLFFLDLSTETFVSTMPFCQASDDD